MTEIKVNGLVIQERDIGENDKLLTVLVERYGKLFVVAKGAKSVRNRHMASCQLFAYSTLGLRKRGNYYYINDSDLIESYYDIRTDISKLALASFICDVVNDVVQEGICEDDILKLSLNTFFAIAKNIKPLEQIRAAFELRIAVESGFAPNFEACASCGKEDLKGAYFDLLDGIVYCQKCKQEMIFTNVENEFSERGLAKPIEIISESVVLAIKYVVNARPERFLSFCIYDLDALQFYDVCEKFLLNQLERGFYSLQFYKNLL